MIISEILRDSLNIKYINMFSTILFVHSQEAFLGPWPAQTLESGLSIVIHNRKSGLQSLGRPGSQKCLLGYV